MGWNTRIGGMKLMYAQRDVEAINLRGYNKDVSYPDLPNGIDSKDLVYAKKLICMIPQLFNKVTLEKDISNASNSLYQKYRNMIVKFKCRFDIDETYFMSIRTINIDMECTFGGGHVKSEKLSCVFDFANSFYSKLFMSNLNGIHRNNYAAKYFISSPSLIFNVIFSECGWLLCSDLQRKEDM